MKLRLACHPVAEPDARMSAVGDPLIEWDLSQHSERSHPLVGERRFRAGGLQGILRVARDTDEAAEIGFCRKCKRKIF